MEELFRFSVTRSADRTDAETVPLARSTKFQSNPSLDPGPPGLEDIAAANSQPPPAKLGDKWSPWRPLWAGFEKASLAYIRTTPTINFIKSIAASPSATNAQQFLQTIKESPHKAWPAELQKLAEPFKTQAAQTRLADSDAGLADLFLALLILRSGGPSRLHAIIRAGKVPPDVAEVLANRPSLDDLADLLRIDYLINLALANPSPVNTAADIQRALAASLLYPPKSFATFEKPVHAVGVADLLVVKQHILRYELGEIARIENILKGETRDHSQKHTLSNERDTFVQTDKETQTDQELTSTDHVNLRNEVANTLKEDLKIDAGLHAQYTGVVNVQADFTVAYDRSSEETKKSSTEIAKDVTQRAAKKITERLQQSETTKIIETFEELEEQKFENKNNPNVSGVYQWVEKVYLAQVFNYGKRLLFDIMVPEPAASLLAADSFPLRKRPIPPDPLGSIKVDAVGSPILDEDGNRQLDQPLTPDQLVEAPTDNFGNPNFGYYGKWVALVRAVGATPPPPPSIVISRTKSFPYQEDQVIGYSEAIPIDDGYYADNGNITVDWVSNDKSKLSDKDATGNHDISFVSVALGGAAPLREAKTFGIDIKNDGPLAVVTAGNVQFAKQEHSISLALTTVDVNELQMTIDVICTLSATAFAKWQLETYLAIATAWQKLQDDYTVKLEAMKLAQQQIGILGEAPAETNRQIERNELKRGSIAILANDRTAVDGKDAIDEWNPENDPTKPFIFADPKLTNAEVEGAWVRWFEQAFDWQNMSYVFYPYFWGRSSEWISRLQRKYESDPLFENFLKAGYARVVIPVHPGFRKAVNFYLATGRPWMGGDLPHIGDKTYLPITEEIKEQTGAPGKEKPVGEPWEYRLPTKLLKLRQHDELPPDWQWVGHEKEYEKDANGQLVFKDPPGTWNWKGDTGG